VALAPHVCPDLLTYLAALPSRQYTLLTRQFSSPGGDSAVGIFGDGEAMSDGLTRLVRALLAIERVGRVQPESLKPGRRQRQQPRQSTPRSVIHHSELRRALQRSLPVVAVTLARSVFLCRNPATTGASTAALLQAIACARQLGVDDVVMAVQPSAWLVVWGSSGGEPVRNRWQRNTHTRVGGDTLGVTGAPPLPLCEADLLDSAETCTQQLLAARECLPQDCAQLASAWRELGRSDVADQVLAALMSRLPTWPL
jgi:hypothetical protein